MTHDLATQNQTAARYLLGELSTAERDEFEEHYFDCTDCAREVRTAAVLRANTKAVLKEGCVPAAQAAAAGESWWRRLFTFRGPVLAPYGAVAALAVVTAYQGAVVIPNLRAASEPQLLVSAALRPTVRGSDLTITVPSDARFFEVTFDVESPTPVAAYECAIVRGNGSPMFAVKAPAGSAGPATLNLLLPAARFQTGEYAVVLRGQPENAAANPVELDRFKFLIERR
jgi:hypothetical protein